MSNDLNLADFLTSVVTRNRITFGDVRRLQRDYLPCGIETRAQAEMLTALAKVEHADRSFGPWFTAALAELAANSAEGDASARDETIAWLEHLSEKPGFARRTGRRIARQLRAGVEPAETTVAAAEETIVDTTVPQEPAVTPAAQDDEPDETERRRRTRVAKRSRIIVRRRPARRTRLQSKCEAMPYAMMPTPWVWSGLMGAQQLQVHLAAPFR